MTLKSYLSGLCIFFLLFAAPAMLNAQVTKDTVTKETAVAEANEEEAEEATVHAADTDAEHHPEPEIWSVLPFVLLLLMIATGPLFYPHFWHRYYPAVAIFLGVLVVLYYLFFLHDTHHPLHSLAEYVSFIALITALFVASGGILIKVDKAGTPLANSSMLVIGAIMANLIGTTGASMLLIRPFIRLNKNRIKPYHVIFFIFIISNVGGSLTPIGDPPLFLGFLKGIPFFWTATNLFLQWGFGVIMLTVIFFFIDRKNHASYFDAKEDGIYSGKIEVKGLHNVLWLAIIIGSVFLDPNVFDWVPALKIEMDGEVMRFSYVRELIMFATAFLAYKFANEECLRGNEFDFEPIKEVAYLFVGIFATMMPALQLIGAFANSEAGRELVNVHSLYWATGALSGVLDNAPTYLNFLSAGMGKAGLDINTQADVSAFTTGETAIHLMAISIAAVFFGAMTYIGNAPNFMVKSIAEQIGIQMPSFMGYVIRYSIPILLPVLFLTWLLFYYL